MASMYYKEMFLENKLAKHSFSVSSVWPVAKLGGSPVADVDVLVSGPKFKVDFEVENKARYL